MRKWTAALAFAFVTTLVVGCGGDTGGGKKGEAPAAPPAGPKGSKPMTPKQAE